MTVLLPVDGLTITKIPGKIPAGSLAYLPDFTSSGAGRARSLFDPTGPACIPIHGSLVVTDQPKLVWEPVKGVERYQITLMKGEETLLQEQIAESHLSLKMPLEPAEYHWKVMYNLDGSEQSVVALLQANGDSKATFHIAAPPLIEEVQALLRLTEDNPDELVLLHFCAAEQPTILFAESTIVFERLKLDENNQSVLASLYNLYQIAGRERDASQVDKSLKKLRLQSRTPD